jgi:hypothetical protein
VSQANVVAVGACKMLRLSREAFLDLTSPHRSPHIYPYLPISPHLSQVLRLSREAFLDLCGLLSELVHENIKRKGRPWHPGKWSNK